MRHVSVIAMLLTLVAASPAAMAQVETPVPALPATPLPVQAPRRPPIWLASRRYH